MWLLFPLLGLVALVLTLALPAQAIWGYLVVLAWVAFMLYLIFYRKDPVARAIHTMNGKGGGR